MVTRATHEHKSSLIRLKKFLNLSSGAPARVNPAHARQIVKSTSLLRVRHQIWVPDPQQALRRGSRNKRREADAPRWPNTYVYGAAFAFCHQSERSRCHRPDHGHARHNLNRVEMKVHGRGRRPCTGELRRASGPVGGSVEAVELRA